jgi:hypothetical protein
MPRFRTWYMDVCGLLAISESGECRTGVGAVTWHVGDLYATILPNIFRSIKVFFRRITNRELAQAYIREHARNMCSETYSEMTNI